MDRFEPQKPDYMTGGSDIPDKMQKPNYPPHHPANLDAPAKDGFDNTGTQGYDSLSDEGYQGQSDNAGKEGPQSHTGSSSEDFHPVKPQADDLKDRDEERVLNSGI